MNQLVIVTARQVSERTNVSPSHVGLRLSLLLQGSLEKKTDVSPPEPPWLLWSGVPQGREIRRKLAAELRERRKCREKS